MPTKKPDAKPAAKPAPKRKAAAAKPKPAVAETAPEPVKVRPPRIPLFVHGDPFTEKTRVPLTGNQFEEKTLLMLEMIRERDVLMVQFESVKADYKARIKDKAEGIAQIQSVMASRAEEQEIALVWRYYPKKGIKRKHHAASGKAVGQAVPMTPEEKRKHSQPNLLDVPAVPPLPKAAAVAVVVKDGEGRNLGELGTGPDGRVGFVETKQPAATPAATELTFGSKVNRTSANESATDEDVPF